MHNAGEVWCAALWEVFVNLVAKHGHAEAEQRMLAYVIGGLKLTPLRPTFTQARDGILAAVSALDPGDLPEVRPASPSAAWAGRRLAAVELVVAGGSGGEFYGVRARAPRYEAPRPRARSFSPATRTPNPEPRDPRATTAPRPRA